VVKVIDVFVLHRDDPNVTIAAFADAPRSQLERGAIESVGVSNWLRERFEALALELGDDSGRLALFSNHLWRGSGGRRLLRSRSRTCCTSRHTFSRPPGRAPATT
jgi:hypothetical protein